MRRILKNVARALKEHGVPKKVIDEAMKAA